MNICESRARFCGSFGISTKAGFHSNLWISMDFKLDSISLNFDGLFGWILVNLVDSKEILEFRWDF